MKLTDLWTAMVAGDHSALEPAYLHRAVRERGSDLIKGREDIAADWAVIGANHPQCAVIVDLGDMAIVEIGDAIYHHWVRREDGPIAFEVLISGTEGHGLNNVTEVVERRVEFEGQTAELYHLFEVGIEGENLRRTGSRILATSHKAVSAHIPNS